MKSGLHNTTDFGDRERIIRAIEIEYARLETRENRPIPEIRPKVAGIYWDRGELRKRITERLKERLDKGLIEEVQRLRSSGLGWERLHAFGLEYRYAGMYLQGAITREELSSRLNIKIGQFAKRQMTWFRRMEAKGLSIKWIPGDDFEALLEYFRSASKK